MITITGIVGTASDPRFAGRLHHLEHDDRVEILVVGEEDASRRRLRGKTDKGTDIAIALERGDELVDGAVLLLEDTRAIVLRKASSAGCASRRAMWTRRSRLVIAPAIITGRCCSSQGLF